MLARTALASAYDDGSYDYATAAKYAYNAIPALDYQDELLLDLADCLYLNGNCNLLQKYANMEAKNERLRTGIELLTELHNVHTGSTKRRPYWRRWVC